MLALNTGSISKNFGADYKFIEQWNTKVEGCDIESGPNVDHVFDLTERPPEYLINKFNLIITSSTLEHVSAPWKAAECLENLLKPGGYIYISVPWVWRYHAYPNDYWRFNRHSLEFLFRQTSIMSQAWSTSPDCELHPYSDSFDDENSIFLNNSHNDNILQRLLQKLKHPERDSCKSKKYLPYLMIHQLRKKVQ